MGRATSADTSVVSQLTSGLAASVRRIR